MKPGELQQPGETPVLAAAQLSFHEQTEPVLEADIRVR
jgi:hypothetical protein